MSNKRDLKKKLNYICSEIFAECVLASQLLSAEDKEQIDTMIAAVLRTHDDFLRRISHPEPGMKPKEYYRVLTDDFNKQMIELVDNIQGLEE